MQFSDCPEQFDAGRKGLKVKERFRKKKDAFKQRVEEWNLRYPDLKEVLSDKYPYEIKNPIVYNVQLDEIVPEKVKYILVGDNPGKNEQQHERYLIGQAGKQAKNFFESLLVEDFYSEVLILNKTPVHTKGTSDLKDLYGNYQDLLRETQEYMANLIFKLHGILGCEVWITGFSGCRNSDGKWLNENRKGSYNLNQQVTPFFFEKIRELYRGSSLSKSFFIFKHFSYGNFRKDLNQADTNLGLREKLDQIGSGYRNELLFN
jgi:hypothetical protein